MTSTLWLCIPLAAWVSTATAHAPPLLPRPRYPALADELAGETQRNLEGLARLHRRLLKDFTPPPSWWQSGRGPTD